MGDCLGRMRKRGKKIQNMRKREFNCKGKYGEPIRKKRKRGKKIQNERKEKEKFGSKEYMGNY